MTETVLLIACGALAKEIVTLQRMNAWSHIKIQCLPAELHNRPEKITPAVKDEIEKHRANFKKIFVAYADCGTGGHLDTLLAQYNIERLAGAHCYEFFAGSAQFAEVADEEPGTFYLTDFLTRHFDRLVKQGLGIAEHPELMSEYFGNYRRVVYLSQVDSPQLRLMAQEHADYLGLAFEHRHTGLGPMQKQLEEQVVTWRS